MQEALTGKGGASLPDSGSPTVRRRELGALLRALRTERGWTVEQVADRLMVSSSKVSRLETGQRGVSARDIRDLCDLYQVTEERRQQLTDLAAEGKQQAWWQSRKIYYSNYVGLEAEAASIHDFGLGVVPGLLQTPDYGRAVLSATRPALPPDVIEQRLASRIERQRLLATANPPEFEAVIDEGVLHRIADSRRAMRVQLEHLLAESERPNVTIRVLPYKAGLLPSNTNKFIILEFATPALQPIVFIEHLTGDLYLDHLEDVAAYQATFGLMREMALTEDETRELLRELAGRSGSD
jgi:transcriptional regulator with XRE-family HTH domain